MGPQSSEDPSLGSMGRPQTCDPSYIDYIDG